MRKRYTKEEIDLISDLAKQGISCEEIGEVFGSTRHTISKYIKIYRRSVECSETIETTS